VVEAVQRFLLTPLPVVLAAHTLVTVEATVVVAVALLQVVEIITTAVVVALAAIQVTVAAAGRHTRIQAVAAVAAAVAAVAVELLPEEVLLKVVAALEF
jgi:hypothetical protein